MLPDMEGWDFRHRQKKDPAIASRSTTTSSLPRSNATSVGRREPAATADTAVILPRMVVRGESALRRTLSRRDLIVYGLLFIGPLAPVGVFGVLEARTGGASALVYLLATIAIAFTAWSYAQMSRAVPHAGSVFAYVTQGLGSHAGFLAGWLAMLDYLLIPSVAYLFSGIALHALVPVGSGVGVHGRGPSVITTAFNLAGVARGRARRLRGARRGACGVRRLRHRRAGVALAAHGPARPWPSPFAGVDRSTPMSIAGGDVDRSAVVSRLRRDRVVCGGEPPATRDRSGRRFSFASARPACCSSRRRISPACSPHRRPRRTWPHIPELQGTAFYDLDAGGDCAVAGDAYSP